MRLPSTVSVRELAEAFRPTAVEVTWACAKVLGPGSRLALLVMLKCYQRLGYFPQLDWLPREVVEYVCAQAVEVFRLIPHGFLNRDLRGLLADLLGKTPLRDHRRPGLLRWPGCSRRSTAGAHTG